MEKTYRIYGEKIGNIWMPSAECTKDFDHIIEKRPEDETLTYPGISAHRIQIHCLRDALLFITNDGDFQNADILWADLEVSWKKGNRYYSRVFNLQGNDGNDDCYRREV